MIGTNDRQHLSSIVKGDKMTEIFQEMDAIRRASKRLLTGKPQFIPEEDRYTNCNIVGVIKSYIEHITGDCRRAWLVQPDGILTELWNLHNIPEIPGEKRREHPEWKKRDEFTEHFPTFAENARHCRLVFSMFPQSAWVAVFDIFPDLSSRQIRWEASWHGSQDV